MCEEHPLKSLSLKEQNNKKNNKLELFCLIDSFWNMIVNTIR